MLRNLVVSREGKIGLVTTVIVVAFLANCCLYYYWTFWAHAAYPHNTFLVNGLFGDYFGSAEAWRHGQFNNVGYGMAYFPGTFLFLAPFAIFSPTIVSALVFAAFVTSFTLIYTFFNVKTDNVVTSIRDAAIIVLMSYPLLFEITTLNLEGIVFVFVCLFIFLYRRGDWAPAAFCLAAAASMKLFPAVFLVLYVRDRRWRDLAACIALAIALSFLPLLIFDGGFFGPGQLPGYLHRLHESLGMYSALMIFSVSGMHFGHSLLNAWQAVAGPYYPGTSKILWPYMVFAAACFLAAAAYVTFVEKILWRRVAVLTIAMCLLPFTSTDYKLMYFLIPLYLFINHRAEPGEWRLDLTFIIMFSLLLIPKAALYSDLWGDVYGSMNTVINPLVMIAMLATIIWSGFARTKAGASGDMRERDASRKLAGSHVTG